MKNISLAIPLLFILSVAFGQEKQEKAATLTGDEKAIHDVEDRFAVAYGRNDAAALDALWAPDYTFVNPAGEVFTKAQRLAAIRSGELKIESYTRDDESIRIYGNTAVVTYRSHVKARRNGQEVGSDRRVITVLVKRDSGWQAVAQQSTHIIER